MEAVLLPPTNTLYYIDLFEQQQLLWIYVNKRSITTKLWSPIGRQPGKSLLTWFI